MRGRVLVAALLLCVMHGGHAQSLADGYGFRPDDEYADDYAPQHVTDTTLFYNFVKQADDLYAVVAGRRPAFARNSRRAAAGLTAKSLFAGLVLEPRNGSVLRSLGAERHAVPMHDGRLAAFGAAAGADEYLFPPACADRISSVGVTFADRGYSAGVRAVAAASLRRGWSIDAAVDARTGRDLHVDGVYTDAAGLAVRVAKRFGDGGELSAVASAHPSERGLRSASSAEAFALTGDNLYNPSWGMQNGRRRNSRVRRELLPMAAAVYTSDAERATTFTAAVAAEAGRVAVSSLGWYGAASPLPDNYRYMPSYFTRDESAAAVSEAWRRGDLRYTQIDWDELCIENRMADHRAAYGLEDRVRDVVNVQCAAAVRTLVGEVLAVSCGARACYGTERHRKQMLDLLGAPFLVDVDYYLLDDDTFTDSRQNDLRHPDRMIFEGDYFGYDYSLRRRSGELWAAADCSSGRFDFAAAARLGGAVIDRLGRYEKEIFAGNGSCGRSARAVFTTWGASMSFGYAFSTGLRLCASLHASADAPRADLLFLNPQYNNRMTDRPQTSRTAGAEASCRYSSPSVQLQASLFAESRRGGMAAERYYDDLAGEYCDMTARGIDILTLGAEAAATVRISRCWYAGAAVSALRVRYTSDPVVSIYSDRTNEAVDPGSAAHMGGCIPGGLPRLTASLTAGYRSSNGWQAALTAAWAGGRRVEASLVRRTERIAYQASSSPESFAAITRQERLPDALNVDLRVAKRWHTGRKSQIEASLAVGNLLGERNNVWSAGESPRVRRVTRGIAAVYEPLPSRLLYAYPRTVLLGATYTF